MDVMPSVYRQPLSANRRPIRQAFVVGRMYLTFMTRTPASIEISELRKRLRLAIDERRKTTAARRAALDAAAAVYTDLLESDRHTSRPEARERTASRRTQFHRFHAERRPAYGARQVRRRFHRVCARHVAGRTLCHSPGESQSRALCRTAREAREGSDRGRPVERRRCAAGASQ